MPEYKYYAHSLPDAPDPAAWQELIDHLTGTCRLAAEFAQSFDADEWAGLGGLWHDLGKYRPSFQNKLLRAAGLPRKFKDTSQSNDTQHSIVGAIQAIKRFGPVGRILAYIIAGHHAGLPDWQTGARSDLAQRLNQSELLAELDCPGVPLEILDHPQPKSLPPRGCDPAFWIRMLFSCLVDADFLDTEGFLNFGKSDLRGGFPGLDSLLPGFESYISNLIDGATPSAVNAIRKEILEQCLQKSGHKPGIFSLNVPTGGGKTLASMGFALNHAVSHGKTRIIYVIPYLSIIEQTADIFRAIFGEAVIEHHSGVVDPESADQGLRNRLASENWDAPIVVTTAVQFFESLFAARPSRCRKLHRIVNSVVVLDEVQLLPPDFINPILHALRELGSFYGVSLVLCTATQPAFEPIHDQDFRFDGLPGVVEIMDEPVALHHRLERIRVHMPHDLRQPTDWAIVAEKICKHDSVLSIVNTRRDALTLFRLLPEGSFHLSAAMCGAHRSDTIRTIKNKLAAAQPVRVVSTQLVECGVDLDFPVVYRAMAGLDSIAQAGGRCNREGLLDRGDLYVFVPPHPSPPGHLRQAEQAGRLVLAGSSGSVLHPDNFTAYFQELFWVKGPGLDRHGIMADLAPDNQGRFNFRTAAEKFQIIDSAEQVTVIVGYGPGRDLIQRIRTIGAERFLLRRAQRYVVNIPRRKAAALLADADIELLPGGIYVQNNDLIYDHRVGLLLDNRLDMEPGDLFV